MTAREQAQGSAASLEKRWNASGLLGTPAPEVWQERWDSTEDRRLALAAAAERCGTVVAGLEHWQAAARKRDLEEQVLARRQEVLPSEFPSEVQPPTEEEVGSQLQNALAQARREARDHEQRLSRLRTLSRTFQSEIETFSEEVLEPIDERTRLFLHALAPELPWAVEESYERTSGRARLITRASRPGHGSPAIDPIAALCSEGELAAIALAQLLSCHTAYPWSKWSALILDDPVQTHDVIHVAAFLDLLRNLVLERGTQVFFTTQDPDLAQWCRRKFDSAGVDCGVLRLSGPGVNRPQPSWE